MKLDTVYKNEELYNIMRSLGIEDSINNLRYNRVVIATDADVDGMHIRNLLLTYFLRFFEDLVVHGHVYILETPLFRVRNKKQTIYCYSEEERDQALEKVSTPEVTRFKGLVKYHLRNSANSSMRICAWCRSTPPVSVKSPSPSSSIWARIHPSGARSLKST